MAFGVSVFHGGCKIVSTLDINYSLAVCGF